MDTIEIIKAKFEEANHLLKLIEDDPRAESARSLIREVCEGRFCLLEDVREEYEDTEGELEQVKDDLRMLVADVFDKDEKIEELEEKIKGLEEEIALFNASND